MALLLQNLIIHGEPVKVIVDDVFPFANNSNFALVGLNETSGNIWPKVLEKALGEIQLIVIGLMKEEFLLFIIVKI